MPVAPGRACASSAAMKMWNISVAPMPSMISMPVASFQRARVAAGSASPAATHFRSGPPSRTPTFRSRAPAAMARYEVGAVKQTVARWATIASSRSGGPAFSSSTVDAPMCIGNTVWPPSPKVNASGGLPMKTSSGAARSTWVGKHTQLAITSR
jgi:hypothetical protein